MIRVTIGYHDAEENIEDGTATYDVDVSCRFAAGEIALDRHSLLVPSDEMWVEDIQELEPSGGCPECGTTPEGQHMDETSTG